MAELRGSDPSNQTGSSGILDQSDWLNLRPPDVISTSITKENRQSSQVKHNPPRVSVFPFGLPVYPWPHRQLLHQRGTNDGRAGEWLPLSLSVDRNEPWDGDVKRSRRYSSLLLANLTEVHLLSLRDNVSCSILFSNTAHWEWRNETCSTENNTSIDLSSEKWIDKYTILPVIWWPSGLSAHQICATVSRYHVSRYDVEDARLKR